MRWDSCAMTVPTADLRLVCLGLVVPLASVALILASHRLLRANRSQRRRPALCLALALLLLGASFVGIARLNGSTALRVIVGVEVLLTGLYVLYVAAGSRPTESRGKRTLGAKWLMGMASLAVVGLPVFAALASEKQTTSDYTPLVHVTTKAISGFGPPRPVFRCTKPTSCEGPKYVAFNSYINNPKIGKEQPFLSFSDPAHPHQAVSDSLYFDHSPKEVTLRAYIDNNTYQSLPGVSTTDALDTHLRLALPTQPVYETNPTVYLYAHNARPKLIWDTVVLRSRRPVRLTYVPGSAKLYRRGPDGRFATSALDGDLAAGEGLDLGRWRADFRYSGFVTFRIRVNPLPEPVRDPLATRAVEPGRLIYLPPATHGLAKEPVNEGGVGYHFTCTRNHCDGPPFPELNAYENHPLLGDEADFVRATSASDYGNNGVELYHTVAVVQPGDEIKVRVTIDNSADPTAIGAPPLWRLIAQNIRARVFIPQVAGRELSIAATLQSTNTQPRAIVDTLPVRSDQNIRLESRPETLTVLTANGLRPLPRTLFAANPNFRTWGQSGIKIAGSLPPSFSKVLYIEFYVRVEPAGLAR